MPTEPTGRLYQAFDTIPDNNSAPAPVGAPEGTMQVNELNNTQRHDKAAIAELAKDVGLDPADFSNVDQPIGWQPMNDVEITGGEVTGLTKAAVDPAFVPANPDDLTDKAYVDAAITTAVGGGLPIGSVIQWYGLAANIPSGWQVCDGTNGTPDMSAKFARGASADGDIGTGGGSDTDTSSSNGGHSHSGSSVASHALQESEIPGHVHASGGLANSAEADHDHYEFIDQPTSGYPAQDSLGTTNSPTEWRGVAATPDRDYQMTSNGTQNRPNRGRSSLNGAHNHTISGNVASTGGGGGHTHGLTVAADGAHTHTVDTVPAYNYLYWIMRVS